MKIKVSLKLIALALLMATLISIFATPAIALTDGMLTLDQTNGGVQSGEQSGENASVVITEDGYKVSDITLREDGKIKLDALITGGSGMATMWQILDPSDSTRWINISGANTKSLSLTCALIGSMLDEQSEAHIRCILKRGSTVISSEPVKVKVSYNAPGYDTPIEEQSEASASRGPIMKATPPTETCTIVINYIFGDGTMAFDPYGATVAKGSDFNATVTSPDIVGYTPYRRTGESYEPSPEVVIDLKNVQSNHTINIIYEPALVEFRVHHHLQNVTDDDYSADPNITTVSHALTGSIVPDGLALTAAELPGFRALSYEKLTVAADGSTVIEIRYDRNYYLVDFEMNGGYGTEPIYVKFGSQIGANMPIRHGYVFDGWDLIKYGNAEPTNEQKSQYDITSTQIIVPDANLKYRARWITQQTTYTMVFWAENADDDAYSYIGHIDNLGAMSGSLASATDLLKQLPDFDEDDYFTFNSVMSDKDVIVEGDGSTIVNAYYTRDRYKITFKANALCAIPVGHKHTDECYTFRCVGNHVHTSECESTFVCEIPEHTAHTESCIRCGYEEHTHGTACCPLTEHTHVLGCWNNVGNRYTGNTRNFPQNVADGYIHRSSSRYYIYVLGTWYSYSGWGASNKDVISPSCGLSNHAHSDECCNIPEHIHTDVCYRDALHTHGTNCYEYSCGQSEHTHSDACRLLNCGIQEGHSHTGTCNSTSSSNVVKVVYRKYDQSLEDIWPITTDHANPTVYNSGERWDPKSSTSYFNNVLVYIPKMLPDDFELTLSAGTASEKKMNYYLEVLPGEEYDKSYTYQSVTRYYKLMRTISAKYNYVTEAEDYFEIHGYTKVISNPTFSGGQINNATNIDFYYRRTNTDKISFNNHGNTVKEDTGIMYGASLSQYSTYVPDYPDNLEPGAYTFVGWYTSPGCYDGTQVDWANTTMHGSDMIFYAKWEPIVHTVKVYQTADLTTQIGSTQHVSHGEFATTPDGAVENGEYVFLGWFYMDGSEEKAFVFNSIPVMQDMNVYAKWSSHVSVDFEVHYILKGTNTKIAESTIGSAIAGNNKTFYAKAGDELFAGYREGYYPTTTSHTVTMGLNTEHIYYFEYEYVEKMPYAVRYVDKLTGEEIYSTEYRMDNKHSVVTETFKQKEKMMPDAYQKRLVLSSSGEDADGDGVKDTNVITFYYERDEEHAFYRVVHYIQNIGAEGYREYRSEELVGIIGNSYTVNALTLSGFSLNKNATLLNGSHIAMSGNSITITLTGEGAQIELYYDRQNVNYTVHYVDKDGNELKPTFTGSGIYGEQISEAAPDLSIQGYTLQSTDSVKSLTLSANETNNVIEFVYREMTSNIKYTVMGGGGAVSLDSENLLSISGVPNGSYPIPISGYKFIGWFTDFTCTVPVDPSMIDPDTNHLVPTKPESGVWARETVYYAKFEAEFVDLTITSSGAVAADANQAFIFRISGVSGTQTAGASVTVVIIGNGSVTVSGLRVGSYTVEELTDWAWKYECSEPHRSVTLAVSTSQNLATFNHSRNAVYWLNSDASSVKIIENPS